MEGGHFWIVRARCWRPIDTPRRLDDRPDDQTDEEVDDDCPGPTVEVAVLPGASELCTLSVRSLKRLTQAGKLPCCVVGGKVLRLKASDVEALILPADECRGW